MLKFEKKILNRLFRLHTYLTQHFQFAIYCIRLKVLELPNGITVVMAHLLNPSKQRQSTQSTSKVVAIWQIYWVIYYMILAKQIFALHYAVRNMQVCMMKINGSQSCYGILCIEHVDRKINSATMIFSNFLSNLELHFFTDALIIKVDCFSDQNSDWNLKEFHSHLILPTEKFNVYVRDIVI